MVIFEQSFWQAIGRETFIVYPFIFLLVVVGWLFILRKKLLEPSVLILFAVYLLSYLFSYKIFEISFLITIIYAVVGGIILFLRVLLAKIRRHEYLPFSPKTEWVSLWSSAFVSSILVMSFGLIYSSIYMIFSSAHEPTRLLAIAESNGGPEGDGIGMVLFRTEDQIIGMNLSSSSLTQIAEDECYELSYYKVVYNANAKIISFDDDKSDITDILVVRIQQSTGCK